MLIVMKQDATLEQIAGVVEIITAMGYEARPMPGRQRTTVGLSVTTGGSTRRASRRWVGWPK